MDDRIRFIKHRGQAIMLIDLSGLAPDQIIVIVNEAQRKIAALPVNSVLTLADFTDSHVDKAAATRIKEALTLDRPHVKRSAWVGTESLPKVFYENFKSFSQRDFPTFSTREQAMDWLTSDE
jgi:hypothetical protein